MQRPKRQALRASPPAEPRTGARCLRDGRLCDTPCQGGPTMYAQYYCAYISRRGVEAGCQAASWTACGRSEAQTRA